MRAPQTLNPLVEDSVDGYSRRTLTPKGDRLGHVSRSRRALRPGAEGLNQQLTEEEQEVSYKRRILHGKIDILRAELVNRLRPARGR